METVRVALRGRALINEPLLNKGTAFSHEERRAFRLMGLLPPNVSELDEQVRRAYDNVMRKSEPIERYIGLVALQDRNETVFYALLQRHLEELAPIIYTPTVGQACQEYSHIYRRPRGVWITPEHRGQIDLVLGDAPCSDAQLIVVTDNERILGLGDLGAGGIGIPIGKLALYTTAAGIHPATTLPVSLDVGTDNEELLQDPLYLGWRQPRLRGVDYDALVEEFVAAVKTRFPRAVLQWEDFKKANALRLLDRYRRQLTSFNDDVQGTAAMAVGGVLAASRLTGTALADQRVLMLGAGASGVGIARHLRHALRGAGVTGDDLVRAICLIDSKGVVHRGRRSLEPHKLDFAWPEEMARAAGLPLDRADLVGCVRAVQPTVLIGTSGQPGVFTESALREMVEHVEQPVVFPLSNPTSKSEAKPADVIEWTAGRALVATGSPFPPVAHGGRTIPIRQANNVYVFPGVGLGSLVAEAREVTDSMFAAAAEALAASVSDRDLAQGMLFPPLAEIGAVTARVAAAVVRRARDDGVGVDVADDEVEARIAARTWQPAYNRYEPIG